MSPLKFCANVSWLFTELPDVSQRLRAAAAAGFQAVEAAWLYDCELRELQRARQAAGVDVVLINTPPGRLLHSCATSAAASTSLRMCFAGDLEAGDLGLGAVPGRGAEFRQGLDLAVTYAKALDCKSRIHLMAGRLPVGSTRSAVAKEMEAIFVQNLKYAADLLSKEGITGLIEPINTRITDPRYFLDSPHQGVVSKLSLCSASVAAEILEKVGKPNLKLQMDVFHWQIMDGNLTQNILKYFPIIGHIQVAQVPGRNEPDSAGELNYKYLFQTLEEHSYQGYIGCSTKDGLGWIKDYWT
ncbi:putative hydroxypyruvate isomerase isoform X11 [Betta splendens]|uniref:Putative hydroxypyruvate isomerase n=1 Tax=Betta splendens TaxID=158456 RepID=A0A9W2XPD0_BETSP|nr:putative hydroxypyruvate isomerase isoform X11 [Betta splendens]XP_055363836.1 putative hydroxypyruvate isomerase isoform X11 [Betta splendens]